MEKFYAMDRLDAVDLKLLRLLQENSRLTIKELSEHVKLSTTPVFERVKRLEREGYIRRYVALLDAEKLHQGITVFCSVRLVKLNYEIAENFVQRVKSVPQVAECYSISGEFDYLLKIYAPDMKYYHDFVLNVLGTFDNLGAINSMFVMNEIKYSMLPVPDAQ